MTVPYVPTALSTPVINPSVGGYGRPALYISPSMYEFAPTAMDTTALVPQGSQKDQVRSLYDTIRRASAWADRYVFGADASAKGASLAATLSVESAYVPVIRSTISLICDYKPIIELVGCDVGNDPSNVQSIGPTLSSAVRFGRRTIYVPVTNQMWYATNVPAQPSNQPVFPSWSGRTYAVWSYVNGYPHSVLASDVAVGDTTVTLEATNGASGFYGVYPGTQFTMYDGSLSESFTVKSVSGTTITTTEAFVNAHTVPPAPDFIPVTTLPADVTNAVIFFTTALIKTRGDNSLVLDEIHEPNEMRASAGGVFEDVAFAMEQLDPYRIRLKAKN